MVGVGQGPAVVMLHGFADTGDMWVPLAWDEITRSPLLWHFNFRGPDVERLVKGRERIYLDRFGTSYPPIRSRSMKRRVSTTPTSTRDRERCVPHSISSRPSRRMR